jgi:hypothetical protein
MRALTNDGIGFRDTASRILRIRSVMRGALGILLVIGLFGQTANAQSINALQRCVQYSGEIIAAATRYHIDPFLFAAVAAQESGGPGQNSGNNHVEVLQNGAVGGGRGLFQLDLHWHAIASTPDAMVPAANADYAAQFLRNLSRRYLNLHSNDAISSALIAYNAGAGELLKDQPCGTTTTWSDGDLCYDTSVKRHRADIVSLVTQPRGCP